MRGTIRFTGWVRENEGTCERNRLRRPVAFPLVSPSLAASRRTPEFKRAMIGDSVTNLLVVHFESETRMYSPAPAKNRGEFFE
ncbi:hypothetical protein RB8902 [Rhodopirellula baltica SH 1]|uniref:Uncharacterized protein n=1 Tax=Rhodopirellula baltica (strain DSM 10527 / NCIMB 13988 / SH1) TaxID=243090 RepID=Q7UMD0_RHOBA|nr:hypothetical protein RB8902 [Rhodopirellula baltica SH 1]